MRCVLAANPGDVGHQWIAARYVFKAAPWVPFDEPKSQRQFVYAPSTFLDNPFIDQDQYRRQLEAACPSDPELLRAWLEGDWAVARGAYFGAVLDEQRNAVPTWKAIPVTGWDRWDDLPRARLREQRPERHLRRRPFPGRGGAGRSPRTRATR